MFDWILLKLRPQDSFTISLDISVDRFVLEFEKYIELEKTYLFEEYYRNSRKYWGTINRNGFQIREKRRFIQSRPHSSNAIGKIKDQNEVVSIDILIKGFPWIWEIGQLLVVPILAIGLFVIIDLPFYIEIVIVFLLLLFFFSMANSVMKRDMRIFKSELLEILNTIENKNALQQRL